MKNQARLRFYDDEHPEGVEVTPAGMGHKFHEALGTGSSALNVFLFHNALSIIDYMKAQ